MGDELLGDDVPERFGHRHPLARPDIDEAALDERLGRLAHGAPADTVLLHEVVFGGQRRSGREVIVEDQVLDLVGDEIREHDPLKRVLHRRPPASNDWPACNCPLI